MKCRNFEQEEMIAQSVKENRIIQQSDLARPQLVLQAFFTPKNKENEKR